MIDFLIKRRNLDTDIHTGRILYEHGGRNWGDSSMSQGMPKVARKTAEASEEV